MNKYEILFEEINSQTKNGTLKWKQVAKGSNSALIFNSNLVYRQFSCQFTRGEDEFTVIFVEKKYEDPESDFAYEKYLPEIIVVEGDELVAEITESVIEGSDMRKLARLIESKSDKSVKLFSVRQNIEPMRMGGDQSLS